MESSRDFLGSFVNNSQFDYNKFNSLVTGIFQNSMKENSKENSRENSEEENSRLVEKMKKKRDREKVEQKEQIASNLKIFIPLLYPQNKVDELEKLINLSEDEFEKELYQEFISLSGKDIADYIINILPIQVIHQEFLNWFHSIKNKSLE
jgi:hypothetical protein